MKRAFSLDIRFLAAAVLAGVAAIVVLGLTAPPERVAILIAGSPLPDGVPLAELDTMARYVEDPTGLIDESTASALSEHVLVVPLATGEPLPRSVLRDPDQHGESDIIGLDLDGAAAVQGWLSPGDRVDVYAAAPEAQLIAQSVPVVAAEREAGTLGAGDVHLLLAVDRDLATTLVAAADNDSIHLVRKGS